MFFIWGLVFLLIILFGLAALGLAFALYLQAEIPPQPLPPAKPAAVSVQPAVPPPPPAAPEAITAPPAESGTLDMEAAPSTPSGAASAAQGGDAP
jgi:hypothetical protein